MTADLKTLEEWVSEKRTHAPLTHELTQTPDLHIQANTRILKKKKDYTDYTILSTAQNSKL